MRMSAGYERANLAEANATFSQYPPTIRIVPLCHVRGVKLVEDVDYLVKPNFRRQL